MSLLDTYRYNVQRKSEEISRLSQDKAREQKKLADLSAKIISASKSINSTKNVSIVQNKLREISRYQNEIAQIEKKIADFEGKIANKQKELINEQKKVNYEEEKELKKRKQEVEKNIRENQKRMKEISTTLTTHNRLHFETRSILNKIQQLPKKIVVLFLASNPLDQERLRLDEEVRAIMEMIRKSKYRDSVKLESCWAIRTMDVLQALNEHSPAIVHFSGHGSDKDEIIFQDFQGNTKLISKEAIVQTMMASTGTIRLVFFNTCFSKNQAEAVIKHVEAAIGMKTSISDTAARIFASQFYSAIGFGLSVKKAFNQAKALIMMEGIPEENTPELFIQDHINPDELIIVRPPNGIG